MSDIITQVLKRRDSFSTLVREKNIMTEKGQRNLKWEVDHSQFRRQEATFSRSLKWPLAHSQEENGNLDATTSRKWICQQSKKAKNSFFPRVSRKEYNLVTPWF